MKKNFKINEDRIGMLKLSFHYRKLTDCIDTLNKLVSYTRDKMNALISQLNNDLPETERDAILRKIIVAERKFRHMIDVPELCLKRCDLKNYNQEKSLLLTIIGILHDLGRIDEIIGQDKNNVFKGRVDHASIGANYLVKGAELSIDDKIHEFVPSYLVHDYWELIKNCVLYHSSLNVPYEKFTTALDKALIEDIRLIDKSSIMNSFLHEDIETIIGIPASKLALTSISDKTFEELTTEQQVNRKLEGEEYTKNRHFMSHVGFIYDMTDYYMLEDNWVSKYLSIYMPIMENDQNKKAEIEKQAVKRIERFSRR